MPTIIRPIVPFQVDFICPRENCDGQMIFTGRWILSPIVTPGQQQKKVALHNCNKCHTGKTLDRPYPMIIHKFLEQKDIDVMNNSQNKGRIYNYEH